jgi:hypothetical protein
MTDTYREPMMTKPYPTALYIHGECVYAVLDAVDCVLRTSKEDEE